MELKKGVKGVLFTESQIRERVRELGAQINRDLGDEGDLIAVGVLKGAIVFFADLIRELKISVRIDFLAVSSYGASTMTSGIVKIVKDLDSDIKDRKVLLIEDIIDSGLTLDYLKRLLFERSPSSLKTCAFLDKKERRKVQVDLDYCGFQIPDEFVVGYGLDYAGCYRNLPYLGILDPSVYKPVDNL